MEKKYEIDNDYYEILVSNRIENLVEDHRIYNTHKEESKELFEAIKSGDINKVGKILNEKPYLICLKDIVGNYSPIESAIAIGQNDITDLIMDKYKNLDAKSRAEVMFWGDEGKIELYDDVVFNNNPYILVVEAIKNNNFDTLKYLYSKFQNIEYNTFFLELAAKNNNPEMTNFVMEEAEKNNKLNFNEECRLGSSKSTILEAAAYSGNIEIFKKALEQNSLSQNKVYNFEDYKLLRLAAKREKTKVVEFLIENGGNVNTKEKEKLNKYIDKKIDFLTKKEHILENRKQTLKSMKEEGFSGEVIDKLEKEIKIRETEIEIRKEEAKKLNKLKKDQENQFDYSVNYLQECKKISNKFEIRKRYTLNLLKNTRKEVNILIAKNKNLSKKSYMSRSRSYNDIKNDIDSSLNEFNTTTFSKTI